MILNSLFTAIFVEMSGLLFDVPEHVIAIKQHGKKDSLHVIPGFKVRLCNTRMCLGLRSRSSFHIHRI